MPKRKVTSEEEEDLVAGDESATDNSDSAVESSNRSTPTTKRSEGTRKKMKSTKEEDKYNAKKSRANQPKTNNITNIGSVEKESSSSSDIMVKSNSDGEKYIELGKKKRVTVRTFKGVPLVDIREFYTDAGGTDKPGKKGLSLGLDQWEALKASSETIEELLASLKNK